MEVEEKKDRRQYVTLDCKAYNQHDKMVASGTAEVMAPAGKILMERPGLPQVDIKA